MKCIFICKHSFKKKVSLQLNEIAIKNAKLFATKEKKHDTSIYADLTCWTKTHFHLVIVL